MDITKYSKKTWIITLVLAAVSIIFDVLVLTGVLGRGDETMESTSRLGLAIAAIAIFYSIKGIIHHIKREREQ